MRWKPSGTAPPSPPCRRCVPVPFPELPWPRCAASTRASTTRRSPPPPPRSPATGKGGLPYRLEPAAAFVGSGGPLSAHRRVLLHHQPHHPRPLHRLRQHHSRFRKATLF